MAVNNLSSESNLTAKFDVIPILQTVGKSLATLLGAAFAAIQVALLLSFRQQKQAPLACQLFGVLHVCRHADVRSTC